VNESARCDVKPEVNIAAEPVLSVQTHPSSGDTLHGLAVVILAISPLLSSALADGLTSRGVMAHEAEEATLDPLSFSQCSAALVDESLPTAPLRCSEFRRAGLAVLAFNGLDAPSAVACLLAGADASLEQTATLEDILAAIALVCAGGSWMPPSVAGEALERLRRLEAAQSSASLLSRREQQVARLAAQGLTNKEISSSLYIALPTVKNHIHRIYAKLGIRRRIELQSRLEAEVSVG
jgi:DNA-binding NarL/FixJ family response regulator